MIDASDIFVKYFEEVIEPFEEYDKFYICETLDDNEIEYDDELVEDVLKGIKEYQAEIKEDALEEEENDFIRAVYDVLDYNYYHLDYKDLGRIFARLSYEQFYG